MAMMMGGLGLSRGPQQTYSQFLQTQLQQAQQDAQQARQMYETVQAQAPQMPGQYIDPMLQKTARLTAMGGLSPQERAVGKQRLGAELGSAAGRIATAGGRRGAFMPGSVSQQVSGRPLQAYAQGSAALEAKGQERKFKGRESVMKTMGGLFEKPWEAAKAGQTAYGEAYRRYGQAREAYGGRGTASRLYNW